MVRSNKLNQPYADAKRFTEVLLERAKVFDVPNPPYQAKESFDYHESKQEYYRRLCLSILSANDFEARNFDEEVDTIIFQDIEYNRPVSLGILPLIDDDIRDYNAEVSFQLLTLKKRRIKQPLSEETRRKMSEAKKGKPTWNKGIPRTDEEKKNISKARKGIKRSEEAIRKTIAANTGKKRTDEFRKKMSEIATGREHTDKTRKKISDTLKKINQ